MSRQSWGSNVLDPLVRKIKLSSNLFNDMGLKIGHESL